MCVIMCTRCVRCPPTISLGCVHVFLFSLIVLLLFSSSSSLHLIDAEIGIVHGCRSAVCRLVNMCFVFLFSLNRV